MNRLAAVLSLPLRWTVRGYQLFISPILPGSCRYHPSCSAYALEALETHGPHMGPFHSVPAPGRNRIRTTGCSVRSVSGPANRRRTVHGEDKKVLAAK